MVLSLCQSAYELLSVFVSASVFLIPKSSKEILLQNIKQKNVCMPEKKTDIITNLVIIYACNVSFCRYKILWFWKLLYQGDEI